MIAYLVGPPNVGKSVLFGRLTGTYVSVSNYPGTTVELTRGYLEINGSSLELVDTPGMYSLSTVTEDEAVAQRLLLKHPPDLVIHVVDAKNVDRMLPLTLAIREMGMNVILVLNMIDEADRMGYSFDCRVLARRLGCPVIPTSATSGRGLDELRRQIAVEVRNSQQPLNVSYPQEIEKAIRRIGHYLSDAAVTKRALALLLLTDESIAWDLARAHTHSYRTLRRSVEEWRAQLTDPALLLVVNARYAAAQELLDGVLDRRRVRAGGSLRDYFGRLMVHPVFGLPFAILVLYFGLYRFVGIFVAGTVVDYLDRSIFLELVNPLMNKAIDWYIPYDALRELLGREYGVFTLALRYSVAIILPIVAGFFLVFSILEDSGYLPRLAILVDRILKRVGLSGRASIPLALGFGCDTLATVVSRTLETRRERIIATFLLALAVPCSAQLGVMLALLSTREYAPAVWLGAVVTVFVLAGYSADRLMPGEKPAFYMEIPPLRVPSLGNIFRKTASRVRWYFLEVLPVFVGVSLLIWVLRRTGLFEKLISSSEPVLRWLGLPKEVAAVFFLGFFRRDYGAAGLYELAQFLSTRQLVVAAVCLTLFVPCIAQLVVMVKEHGILTAAVIALAVLICALFTGVLLNSILAGVEYLMLTGSFGGMALAPG